MKNFDDENFAIYGMLDFIYMYILQLEKAFRQIPEESEHKSALREKFVRKYFTRLMVRVHVHDCTFVLCVDDSIYN